MGLRCSIYKNAWDEASTNYVDVLAILNGIKSERWGNTIEEIRTCVDKTARDGLKMNIPAACFSGTFKVTRVYSSKKGKYEDKTRLDTNIVDYTQLVVIDIDIYSEKLVNRLRNMLVDDPYVFAYFKSPSGGLKILYKVDSEAIHHKEFAFEQIKSWVEDNYSVEVDKSGKNMSRLCFISSDPELFVNQECESFEVDTTKKEEDSFVRAYDNSDAQAETDINEIYRVAKGWLSAKGEHYVTGNRNEYIYKMACILNRSGLVASQVVQAITNNHSINAKMYQELIFTVNTCCKTRSSEFGTKIIFGKKKKGNSMNDLTSMM